MCQMHLINKPILTSGSKTGSQTDSSDGLAATGVIIHYDYDYSMAPQRGRPYGANLGSMGRNTGTWSIRSECLSNPVYSYGPLCGNCDRSHTLQVQLMVHMQVQPTDRHRAYCLLHLPRSVHPAVCHSYIKPQQPFCIVHVLPWFIRYRQGIGRPKSSVPLCQWFPPCTHHRLPLDVLPITNYQMAPSKRGAVLTQWGAGAVAAPANGTLKSGLILEVRRRHHHQT